MHSDWLKLIMLLALPIRMLYLSAGDVAYDGRHCA